MSASLSIPSASTVRRVLCLTEDMHRDLAVADAAVAGRFTHHGITMELGRRPDWLQGCRDDDDEWRIEWVKLYEGLDLAHAYETTGDAEYRRTWEDLVGSFCEQVPVGYDTSDVTARRLQNWLYAWPRLHGADEPTGEADRAFAERVVARVRADADHLVGHLTAERNHRTLELYTLFLVGLALEPALERASEALDALAENATTDIWDDGVHRECSTDYHLIVLRSFVGAIANGAAAGLDVPDALVDRAARACDFALHVQRPDGTTPALSDGDQGDFRSLLAIAGDVLDRPDLTWAATGGARGVAPARRLVSFSVGGYHVQRSGWGDSSRTYSDERYCVMDCGPLGDGGHGHYDQLSVEMAGGGRNLVIDPGRFTYADDDTGWRQWFKGTAAHNTVTVDGLDQTPFRPGKPGRGVSHARLVGRHTAPGLDVIVGEVRSACYEALHTRTVAFVEDDFWLVHDRMHGERPHRYEARWHLTPEATGHARVERANGSVTVRAPGLVVSVPRWCGEVSIADGWVSPSYGVKLPAPVVVVTAAERNDADIVTAVVPGAGRVDLTAECTAACCEATITVPGAEVHRIRWCVDDPHRATSERLR